MAPKLGNLLRLNLREILLIVVALAALSAWYVDHRRLLAINLRVSLIESSWTRYNEVADIAKYAEYHREEIGDLEVLRRYFDTSNLMGIYFAFEVEDVLESYNHKAHSADLVRKIAKIWECSNAQDLLQRCQKLDDNLKYGGYASPESNHFVEFDSFLNRVFSDASTQSPPR